MPYAATQAVLSLAPLLELVAALARDLQADFVPLLRPTLARLSALAEAKGVHEYVMAPPGGGVDNPTLS